MKDFSNGSFAPDTIKIMTTAMESAISTLPHPAGSAQTQSVAETILRSTKDGERDPAVLARLALLELIISPRTWYLSDQATPALFVISHHVECARRSVAEVASPLPSEGDAQRSPNSAMPEAHGTTQEISFP
jgi:hypothetical protein